MEVGELKQIARRLRRSTIEALYAAQSGHPGSAMSTMDMLVALYLGGLARLRPEDKDGDGRDYFILSNGHACAGWYSVLAEAGWFKPEEVKQFRRLNSPAQGHPHRGSLPGVEVSAGSLGQGLSVGIGLALGLKLKQKTGRVFVMMSDGEQEEGSTWEAVMFAPKMKLDNLVAVIDKNQMQIDGPTKKVMPSLDPLADKYQAFNWAVQEIDGHDFKELMAALRAAIAAKKPAVIIAKTIRGQGVSFMEGSEHWHAGAISDEQYEQAMAELS